MTDGFHERTWQGGEPFELPMTGGVLTPTDPSTFTASMRWLQLDHVRVHLLVAGSHRFSSSPREEPPPVITLAMGEGEVEFLLPGRTSTLRKGDIAISDEQATSGHRTDGPIRVLWSVIGREHVHGSLLTEAPFPAFLARTRLVNSYLAFMSALVTGRAETDDGPDAFLVQALVDLQMSVLAERRRMASSGGDRLLDLRGQIEQHIAAHLADQDLAPSSIADSLGISVRYAHQVFNRDGETIAAYVRNSRLDAVAQALQKPSPVPRPGELAERYGFASRDHLSRAFRRRFGGTISEYRARQER